MILSKEGLFYLKAFLITTILLSVLFLPLLAMASIEDEKRTVAIVLSAEACGEGLKGLSLVAETVRNRSILNHQSFYQVVTAPNQYYGLKAPSRHKLYKQCKENTDYVVDLLYNGKLGNLTQGALYFRTSKERLFPWCKVLTYKYKNHLFYR